MTDCEPIAQTRAASRDLDSKAKGSQPRIAQTATGRKGGRRDHCAEGNTAPSDAPPMHLHWASAVAPAAIVVDCAEGHGVQPVGPVDF